VLAAGADGGVGAGVTSSGTALGVLVGNAAAASAWRNRGARYIAVSLEGLIRESSQTFQNACAVSLSAVEWPAEEARRDLS
jgi:hypothetical protein